MMIVTLPVVYPIIMALGFDSVWFGIMLVMLAELGMITPPVGINLYIIHHVSGGVSMTEVLKGSIPYFFLLLIGLALVTAFPQLALWLPGKMMTVSR